MKNPKRSPQNSRKQGFSYYFWLMTEGSGSIPLTSRSGSGRPKKMWIQWTGIQIRIRIPITACDVGENKRPVLYIGLVIKLIT